MTAHTDACWVVTPGHAGMENQAIGLAEAVGTPYVVKRVHPRPPWTWLPVTAWPAPLAALDGSSDSMTRPWPTLLIASGRRSIPYALHIRRASGRATVTVYLQDPRIDPAHFDLVAAPRHDALTGDNVITTIGAPNRVTQTRLAEAAARIAPHLPDLPRPLVAVLIGGSNSCYRLTPERVESLAAELKAMALQDGCGLLVTPSRRTGAESVARLTGALAGAPAVVWDLAGDNPYFGYLGLADAVVVTCDSVSMASEACTTGKPVFVAPLDGGSKKFRAFHTTLEEAGYTKPFHGRLEMWRSRPLDDTARVAAEVRRYMVVRYGIGAAVPAAMSGAM